MSDYEESKAAFYEYEAQENEERNENMKSIGKIFLIFAIILVLFGIGITMILFGNKYIKNNDKETSKYKGGIALVVFGCIFIVLGIIVGIISPML